MTPKSRLEPTEVHIDGSNVRIANLEGDPDVMLEFKAEESAKTAWRAIRNYLEVVDVDCNDESVMHMLEVVLGHGGSSES